MDDKLPIGGWLTPEEGDAFQEYALQLGLDESALATLLLNRELRLHRLGTLNPRNGSGKVAKGKRVSARPRAAGFKKSFGQHAKSHGFASDAAASVIFRTELEERWLDRCLSIAGNQLDSQPE